jgi:hypothetical protein
VPRRSSGRLAHGRGTWSTPLVFAPLLLLGLVAAVSAGEREPALTAPILSSAFALSAAGAGAPVEAPVRLAFAGDLSLSIQVGINIEARARGKRPSLAPDYPFSAVKDRIASADIALGNLECVTSPIGERTSPFPTLRAPVLAIPLIRDAGFDVVSLANNHTEDFGRGAFADMVARLDQAGLPHIGQGFRSIHPEEPLIREVRGVRLGFIAFGDVEPDKAYRDVARARPKVDVLVIFNHWGREDSTAPLAVQRRLGRGLVEAGADLIVGAHAHVLQPEEWYQGKLIFYGLGNFVFSGMGHDERRRVGGYLEVDVDRRGVVARRLYRIRLDDSGAPQWLDATPTAPARISSSP